MPFDQNTKARMFIKSARICCLCYKQCGTNIEAAHIVSESESNDNSEENGIPLCFDCHQEIGAYDPKHPKGNKFTEIELKSRRNKIYELVEEGFLQAHLIAKRYIKRINVESSSQILLEKKSDYKPSKEVKSIIDLALDEYTSHEIVPVKLQLISEDDVAYVIDLLVEEFEKDKGLDSLFAIISDSRYKDKSLIILEQILRKVTILNDLDLKNNFMQGAPTDILNTTDIGLREAFFLEIISILEKVQFKEVNKITSSVTRIQESIPSNLRDRYIRSLIKLIGSGAWHAEPIAKSTLLSLPQEMLKSTFNIYDKEFFLWHSNEEFHKEFLRKYFSHWPKDKAKLFNDYLELSRLELLNKYDMSFKRSNNN